MDRFPLMLYRANPAGQQVFDKIPCDTLVVHSEAEQDAAEADGWRTSPAAAAPARIEAELAAREAAEAEERARVDALTADARAPLEAKLAELQKQLDEQARGASDAQTKMATQHASELSKLQADNDDLRAKLKAAGDAGADGDKQAKPAGGAKAKA